MNPTEENPYDEAGRSARTDGGERRTDGAGTVTSGPEDEPSDRASAFVSESDYTMSRADEIRELSDRKFYAPLKILMADYRGVFGLGILLLYIGMGTVGVALYPEPEPGDLYLYPWFQTLEYPLGTDAVGKDLLGMVIHATPRMLQMMLGGAIFAIAMSVGVGTVAGFKRGTTDRVLMTITDTAMNLPSIPLLLVLVAVLQPENPFLIGVILSINRWAGGARSIRAEVLSLRQADYVEATRAMGISTSRNIQTNIVPSLLPLIMIRLMGTLRWVIFAAVGLYFLNVLPVNFLNWGVMLNTAYEHVSFVNLSGMHYLWVPLIVISLFGIGTTFLAQGFDRVFNPRLRAKHARSISGDAEEGEGQSADVVAEEVMFG